jgi:electron transport complex protein RnfB
MSLVWIAIASMVVLGVVFGLGLAAASRAFHVEVDPRVEEVLDTLPQLNCGACGYRNCEDYAEAVALKGAEPDLCVPGGTDTAQAVGTIMGLEVGEKEVLRAYLHCQGTMERCRARFEYDGPPNCRASVTVQNGWKACFYGCLGLGDCVEVCPVGAITIGHDKLPVVDRDLCIGCGMCVDVCPRNLYELLPVQRVGVYLGCSSQDKGRSVKDACSVGCIACQKCVKVDPKAAIQMKGNLPDLDYGQGSTFLEAAEACPMNCFVVLEGAAEKARAAAPAAESAEA